MIEYGDLPFAEQIAAFLAKYPVLAEAAADVYAAEHEAAFMVAGAAKADLLNDLHRAVEKAVTEGTGLKQFRKDFDSIVEKNGWDHSGNRNWRTRIIYDTNLRQSFHAGREEQMADPALQKERPYGLYRHGRSEHPRPRHLEWDSIVLPLDDPWWDTHTPQNGYLCKCRKKMLSKRDVERKRLKVLEEAPPLELEEVTIGQRSGNPKTVTVPKGIDPGFEYRPGEKRLERLEAQYREKALTLSGPAAESAESALTEYRETKGA